MVITFVKAERPGLRSRSCRLFQWYASRAYGNGTRCFAFSI